MLFALMDLFFLPLRLMAALMRTAWFWLFFVLGGLLISAVFGVLRYAIPIALIYTGVRMMLGSRKN